MDTPIVQQSRGDYPDVYWGDHMLFGVTAWIQAFYMLILLAIWNTQLDLFTAVMSLFSWVWASVNVVGFAPVGILFILSGPYDDSRNLNGWYYGFQVASMIYQWFVAFFNFIWFFILYIWAAFLHDFTDGESKPSTAVAWVGMLIQLALTIMYTWSGKRATRIVKCWWKGANTQYCDF